LIPERKLGNLGPMRGKLGIICQHQRACPFHRDEYPIEIVRGALVFDLQVDAEIARRSLGLQHILSRGRTGRAHQNRDSGELGKQLFHHLQSLRNDIAADAGRSSDSAAGLGEACDEPGRDRIQRSDENDRDLACSVPGRENGRRSRGDDDVYSAPYQLGRSGRNFRSALSQAVLDYKVLSFDKT
jgi:hypothetical protein